MNLSKVDVKVMRLLDHARSLACHVVQDIAPRHFVILALVGSHVRCADIATARAWLREYASCGMHGRRCFEHGKHICRSFERSC
jgi:hypothetical protein